MILLHVIIAALLNFTVVVYSQYNCITPNGEQGHCIPLNQCRILFNSIYNPNPQIQHFLRQSECSYSRIPYVCCGSVAWYATLPHIYKNSQKTRTKSPPFTLLHQNIDKSSSHISEPKRHRNIKLLPRSGQCGQQGLQDKIFGGTEAGLDEFPWLALLRYRKDEKDVGFHCGGMLINERYVLTAAHCITGNIRRYFGDAYQVRLGEFDTKTVQDCTFDGNCNEPPQDEIIEEAIFHTGYNEKTESKYHDIALLRLRNPIKLSYFIQPICLPVNGERTTPGTNMSIAGWGRTEFASKSDVKLKAKVPIVSQAQCNNAYSIGSISDDNQLCAGGQKGVDSCNGDSGGPIMNLLSDGETWYAEGLVSFGPQNCGTENLPGVYTRIYGYLNWILDNMRA